MKNKNSEYICNDCYSKKNNKTIEKFSISPLTALCETCEKKLTNFYIFDEFDNLTPCCKKELKLKLFPDYTSSGIWCFHCGCNLSSELSNIPDGLINLCGVWNDLWDHQINSQFYVRDDYFGDVFISTGKYLCELINQYCYCEFNITKEEIVEEVINQRKR